MRTQVLLFLIQNIYRQTLMRLFNFQWPHSAYGVGWSGLIEIDCIETFHQAGTCMYDGLSVVILLDVLNRSFHNLEMSLVRCVWELQKTINAVFKISWWLHCMEVLPHNWPFVRGIRRIPKDITQRGPVMWSLDNSVIVYSLGLSEAYWQ